MCSGQATSISDQIGQLVDHLVENSQILVSILREVC